MQNLGLDNTSKTNPWSIYQAAARQRAFGEQGRITVKCSRCRWRKTVFPQNLAGVFAAHKEAKHS